MASISCQHIYFKISYKHLRLMHSLSPRNFYMKPGYQAGLHLTAIIYLIIMSSPLSKNICGFIFLATVNVIIDSLVVLKQQNLSTFLLLRRNMLHANDAFHTKPESIKCLIGILSF